MKKILFLSALFIFGFASCSKDDDPSITDEGVVINNVRWATRNLDYPGTFAPYPHSAGRLYQWGTLDGVTHHWPSIGEVTNWNNSDDRVAWTFANDPCPTGWRVPTSHELGLLISAGSVWRMYNDTYGFFLGTEPNQIFLPITSHRGLSGIHAVGGYYWSRTPSSSPNRAWSLRILHQQQIRLQSSTTVIGMNIRCVAR